MKNTFSRLLRSPQAISFYLLALITGLVLASARLASAWYPPKDEQVFSLPADGWLVSTPEDQGMSSIPLQDMMTLIDEQAFAYDAVLVTRHGQIVFEEYRNGYDQSTKHHLQSATKSISSLLIGIAIQEGYLQGVDQKMVDLFPDYRMANLDSRKKDITLEHLLTMSDGMDWHELDYPYQDPRNTLGQMWNSRDFIQFVLDQPMARDPGESWSYNSGTSILLGGILEEATGQDLLAFANTHLFEPLGISDVTWTKTRGNHYHTDGGLYLTPRDMALIGNLMLRNGTWGTSQIIDSEWIARSTEKNYQADSGKGYGYQWWTMADGIYLASGHYDQKIYVIPQADMVVVFTGNIPDTIIPPSDGFLYQNILAACGDLPPRQQKLNYENYGFSFAYPAGFEISEYPLPGQDEVSPQAGMVQFMLTAYPFELVQVTWLPGRQETDLKEFLAAYSASTSAVSGAAYTPGQLKNWSKDGQAAYFQSFAFDLEGIQLKGANVIWYCPAGSRIFNFSFATNEDVPDADMIDALQKHLAQFSCQLTETE